MGNTTAFVSSTARPVASISPRKANQQSRAGVYNREEFDLTPDPDAVNFFALAKYESQ